jgi:hypothetical protein
MLWDMISWVKENTDLEIVTVRKQDSNEKKVSLLTRL